MSTSRKIRRKKELRSRKKANKVLKKATEAIEKMTKECSGCNRVFDKSDRSMIDSWHIAVYPTGESELTCDMCFSDSRS